MQRLFSMLGTISVDNTQANSALSQTKAQAKSTASSLSSTLGKSGKSIRAVGADLTGLSLIFSGLTAGVVKFSGEYEQALSGLQAMVVPDLDPKFGKFSKEMQALSKEALELGANTAYSATEVAEAMKELGAMGWNYQKILEGISGILNLASIEHMNLAHAAKVVGKTINQFGLEAKDAVKVSDMLVSASVNSATSVESMASALEYAGQSAAGTNQSLEETLAILAAMSQSGAEASKAGTGLSTALIRMASDKRAIATMKDLGVEVENSSGQMRSMIDIFDELSESGASVGQLDKIFGKNAGPEAKAAMQNADLARELKKQIQQSEGLAQRMSTIMRDNLSSDLETLGGAFQSLAIAIGNSGLLQGFRLMVQGLTDIIDGLARLDPEVLRTASIIGVLVAGLGPALMALGQFSILISAAMNPVGYFIIAITAIGAAFVALANSGKSLGEWLKELPKLLGNLSTRFVTLGKNVSEGFVRGVSELPSKIIAFFGKMVQGVKSFLGIQSPSRVFEFIGQMIGEGLAAGIERRMPKFGPIFQDLVSDVQAWAERMGEEFDQWKKDDSKGIPWFQDDLDNAKESFDKWIDGLQEDYKKWNKGGREGLPWFQNDLDDALDAFKDWSKRVSKDMKSWSKRNAKDFNPFGYAGDVGKRILDNLMTPAQFTQIRERMEGVFETLSIGTGGVRSTASSYGFSIGASVGVGIASAINEIPGAIRDPLNTVFEWIGNNIQVGALGGLLRAGNKLVNVLVPAMTASLRKEWVAAFFGGIGDSFSESEVGQRLQPFFKEIGKGFGVGLKDMDPKEFLTGTFENFAGYIIGQAVALGKDIMSGIRTGLSSDGLGKGANVNAFITRATGSILGEGARTIKDAAGRAFGPAINAGLASIDIKEGAKSLFNNFGDDAARSIVGGTVKEDVGAAAEEVGKQAVAGFNKGVEEKGLEESVQKFGGVISSVKDTYGIQSPSKVFQDIGRNIIDGFNQGIDSAWGGVKSRMNQFGALIGDTFDSITQSNPQLQETIRLIAELTAQTVVFAATMTGITAGLIRFNKQVPVWTKSLKAQNAAMALAAQQTSAYGGSLALLSSEFRRHVVYMGQQWGIFKKEFQEGVDPDISRMWMEKHFSNERMALRKDLRERQKWARERKRTLNDLNEDELKTLSDEVAKKRFDFNESMRADNRALEDGYARVKDARSQANRSVIEQIRVAAQDEVVTTQDAFRDIEDKRRGDLRESLKNIRREARDKIDALNESNGKIVAKLKAQYQSYANNAAKMAESSVESWSRAERNKIIEEYRKTGETLKKSIDEQVKIHREKAEGSKYSTSKAKGAYFKRLIGSDPELQASRLKYKNLKKNEAIALDGIASQRSDKFREFMEAERANLRIRKSELDKALADEAKEYRNLYNYEKDLAEDALEDARAKAYHQIEIERRKRVDIGREWSETKMLYRQTINDQNDLHKKGQRDLEASLRENRARNVSQMQGYRFTPEKQQVDRQMVELRRSVRAGLDAVNDEARTYGDKIGQNMDLVRLDRGGFRRALDKGELSKIGDATKIRADLEALNEASVMPKDSIFNKNFDKPLANLTKLGFVLKSVAAGMLAWNLVFDPSKLAGIAMGFSSVLSVMGNALSRYSDNLMQTTRYMNSDVLIAGTTAFAAAIRVLGTAFNTLSNVFDGSLFNKMMKTIGNFGIAASASLLAFGKSIGSDFIQSMAVDMGKASLKLRGTTAFKVIEFFDIIYDTAREIASAIGTEIGRMVATVQSVMMGFPQAFGANVKEGMRPLQVAQTVIGAFSERVKDAFVNTYSADVKKFFLVFGGADIVNKALDRLSETFPRLAKSIRKLLREQELSSKQWILAGTVLATMGAAIAQVLGIFNPFAAGWARLVGLFNAGNAALKLTVAIFNPLSATMAGTVLGVTALVGTIGLLVSALTNLNGTRATLDGIFTSVKDISGATEALFGKETNKVLAFGAALTTVAGAWRASLIVVKGFAKLKGLISMVSGAGGGAGGAAGVGRILKIAKNWNAVGIALTAATGFVFTFFRSIQEGGDDWEKYFVAGIEDGAKKFVSVLGGAIKNVTLAIWGIFDWDAKLETKTEEMAYAFGEGFREHVLGGIGNFLVGLASDKALTDAKGIGQKLGGALGVAIRKFAVQALKSLGEELSKYVTNSMQDAIDKIKLPEFKNPFAKKTSSSGGRDVTPTSTPSVNGVPISIYGDRNEAARLEAEAHKRGVSLNEGIIAGLKDSSPAVRQAAINQAKVLLGAWDKETDTHSPSKEMIKRGQQIADGVIIGLEKSGGEVSDEAKAMAALVAGKFADEENFTNMPDAIRKALAEVNRAMQEQAEQTSVVKEGGFFGPETTKLAVKAVENMGDETAQAAVKAAYDSANAVSKEAASNADLVKGGFLKIMEGMWQSVSGTNQKKLAESARLYLNGMSETQMSKVVDNAGKASKAAENTAKAARKAIEEEIIAHERSLDEAGYTTEEKIKYFSQLSIAAKDNAFVQMSYLVKLRQLEDQLNGQNVVNAQRTTEELMALSSKRMGHEAVISRGGLELLTAQYSMAVEMGKVSTSRQIEMLQTIADNDKLTKLQRMAAELELYNLQQQLGDEAETREQERQSRIEERQQKIDQMYQNKVTDANIAVDVSGDQGAEIDKQLAHLVPVRKELERQMRVMAENGKVGTDAYRRVYEQLTAVKGGIQGLVDKQTELSQSMRDNWLNKLTLQARYGVRGFKEINAELEKTKQRLKGEIDELKGKPFTSQEDIDNLSDLENKYNSVSDTQRAITEENFSNEKKLSDARKQFMIETGQLTLREQRNMLKGDIERIESVMGKEAEGFDFYWQLRSELLGLNEQLKESDEQRAEATRKAAEDEAAALQDILQQLREVDAAEQALAKTRADISTENRVVALEKENELLTANIDRRREAARESSKNSITQINTRAKRQDADNQKLLQNMRDILRARKEQNREELKALDIQIKLKEAESKGTGPEASEAKKELFGLKAERATLANEQRTEEKQLQDDIVNIRKGAARDSANVAMNLAKKTQQTVANTNRKVRDAEQQLYDWRMEQGNVPLEEQVKHLRKLQNVGQTAATVMVGQVKVHTAEWYELQAQIEEVIQKMKQAKDQKWQESVNRRVNKAENDYAQGDMSFEGYRGMLEAQIELVRNKTEKETKLERELTARLKELNHDKTMSVIEEQDEQIAYMREAGMISLEEERVLLQAQLNMLNLSATEEYEIRRKLAENVKAIEAEKWNAIKTIATNVGTKIGQVLSSSVSSEYSDELTTKISESFGNAVDRIKTALDTMRNQNASSAAVIRNTWSAVGATLGAVFQTFSKKAGDGFDTLATLASGAVSVLQGLATGGPLGAIAAGIGVVVSAMGDMANGAEEVNRELAEAAKGTKSFGEEVMKNLYDGAMQRMGRTPPRESRGGILGFLGFTKEVIDEEVRDYVVDIVTTLDQGINDAFSQAASDFAQGGMTFVQYGEAIRKALFKTIMDAVTKAVIANSVAMKKLGPLIQRLAEAIIKGDMAAVASITGEIGVVANQVVAETGPILYQAGLSIGGQLGQGIAAGIANTPMGQMGFTGPMDANFQNFGQNQMHFENWKHQQDMAWQSKQQAASRAFQWKQQDAADAFAKRQEAQSAAFQRRQQAQQKAFSKRQEKQAEAFQKKQEKQAEAFAKKQERQQEQFDKQQEARQEAYDRKKEAREEQRQKENERIEKLWNKRTKAIEEAFSEAQNLREEKFQERLKKLERKYDEEAEERKDKWAEARAEDTRLYEVELQEQKRLFSEAQREEDRLFQKSLNYEQEVFNEEQRKKDEEQQKNFEARQRAIDAQLEMEFASDAAQRETIRADYVKEVAKEARRKQLEAGLRAEEEAYEQRKRDAEAAFQEEQRLKQVVFAEQQRLTEAYYDEEQRLKKVEWDNAQRALAKEYDKQAELEKQTWLTTVYQPLEKRFEDAQKAREVAHELQMENREEQHKIFMENREKEFRNSERLKDKAFSNSQEQRAKNFQEQQKNAQKRFDEGQQRAAKAFQDKQERQAEAFARKQERAAKAFQDKQTAAQKTFSRKQELQAEAFQRKQQNADFRHQQEMHKREAQFWQNLWNAQNTDWAKYTLNPSGLALPPVKFPKLAEGGLVTKPTLAMIGEAGAEVVIPMNKVAGFSDPSAIEKMKFGQWKNESNNKEKALDAIRVLELKKEANEKKNEERMAAELNAMRMKQVFHEISKGFSVQSIGGNTLPVSQLGAKALSKTSGNVVNNYNNNAKITINATVRSDGDIRKLTQQIGTLMNRANRGV